jgi:SAM-dependent methyltransferase
MTAARRAAIVRGMEPRDTRADWRRYEAERIPTKSVTPRLEDFLDEVARATATGGAPAVFDIGCGTGAVARRMAARGFVVTGIDVNPQAVESARRTAAKTSMESCRFLVADAAAADAAGLPDGPFDAVVCQLVISIIGGPDDRARLLRAACSRLRPGGRLYVSASGVSDEVNPGYARLYAQDRAATGEPFTYFSRDDAGRILYATHHFTPEELAGLMTAAGFGEVAVAVEREASSRRPEEAAIFLYATAIRPLPV